jgi:hypothetical protein
MGSRSDKPVYILAVVIGLLIAPVKLVYSFFPFFNLTDLVGFWSSGWLIRLLQTRKILAVGIVAEYPLRPIMSGIRPTTRK